jgi:trehalose 6-phosphate phosphatase
MTPERAPPPSLLDGAALFLDFDGTLVEIADAPDAISVPRELGPLLHSLSDRLQGRLAIVTGRALRDLERHLDCSGTAVAGSHGLELRFADGTHTPVAIPAGLADAVAAVHRLAEAVPGLLVEEKPAGVAVHFRKAPEEGQRVEDAVRDIAGRSGLKVQAGKMLFELRSPGADKGDAVRTFMKEAPFAGACPLVVGDDLTDEDAFAVAAELGGAGILIGPLRPSHAKWRLNGVTEARNWLQQAVGVR